LVKVTLSLFLCTHSLKQEKIDLLNFLQNWQTALPDA
jgi:hypothetical protein